MCVRCGTETHKRRFCEVSSVANVPEREREKGEGNKKKSFKCSEQCCNAVVTHRSCMCWHSGITLLPTQEPSTSITLSTTCSVCFVSLAAPLLCVYVRGMKLMILYMRVCVCVESFIMLLSSPDSIFCVAAITHLLSGSACCCVRHALWTPTQPQGVSS